MMFSKSSAGSCSVRLCFQPPDFHLVDVLLVLSSPVRLARLALVLAVGCWLVVGVSAAT